VYAGKLQEGRGVEDLSQNPFPPASGGRRGPPPKSDEDRDRRTKTPGPRPPPLTPPVGCRFNPRCSYAMDVCITDEPTLDGVRGENAHRTRCWLDQATKDREAAKFAAERMAEAV